MSPQSIISESQTSWTCSFVSQDHASWLKSAMLKNQLAQTIFLSLPTLSWQIGRAAYNEQNPSLMLFFDAAKVTPSIQLTPKSILACLADCLSELVSLIKDSIENKKPLNDLAPFKIVSLAASRHMNVNFDANDILLGVISPTPASSPEKSLAPSQSQSGSPEISPSIQMQLS